ncbi:hypothetical protein [Microbacterium sp.]|uniref:hypothetical protein n=1 Tax=Microbacterium sp. TaxID=51671 RepID=UPI00391B6564
MRDVIVEAIGTRIAIDVTGLPPGDRETVGALWADAAPPVPHTDALPASVVRLGGAFEFSSALADLSTRVTVAALGARRGEVWMLHAGGVADEAGRVAVLIGPSGAGKTTAVTALGAHLGYVSDESIGVENSGRVLAYRKPLSVVRAGESWKEQIPPSALGLLPLPEGPLVLAALILLDRRRDPSSGSREPVLTPVAEGEAIAMMAEQSSYLTMMPRPLQTIRSHLRRLGGVHRLAYDDASQLPAVVRGLLAADRGASGIAVEGDVDATGLFEEVTASLDIGRSDHAVYSRVPFLDEATVAGAQVVILREGDDGPAQVTVLTPLAGAVWHALVRPRAVHDAALRRVADELVEHGLLRRAADLATPPG